MRKNIGSPTHSLPELFQPHKTIKLSGNLNQGISDQIVNLYRQGLSITDIRKQAGKPKSTVREILLRAGIELRPQRSPQNVSTWRDSGKRNVRPPYGFCYFQGRVVPDPRENENLLLIHRWWQEGLNPNAIACRLNEKKISARSAGNWNRNSIVNIIDRFKNKTVVVKGGQCELR